MNAATLSRPELVSSALQRLESARRTGTPCSPVRSLIGADDVQLAYEVQSAWVQNELARGARRVGRKIGLTSPAVQTQLGVDQPDFGTLLDDMDYSAFDEIPVGALLQPRIEAEIAFVLAADLLEPPFSDARLAAAVEYTVAALEIVDSRVAGWDIRIADTVADNASAGGYVLGRVIASAGFVPREASMRMAKNGVVVSTGAGRDCLGDPLNALRWLADTAAAVGDPLRAGEVVLSGALGPMVDVRAGDDFVADITGLGRVQARFAGGER